jgi:hypothetical protein
MKLPRVSCVLLSLLISAAVCCRSNGVDGSRLSAQTLASPGRIAVNLQEPAPPDKSEADSQNKYRVIRRVRREGWKVPGVDKNLVSSERREFKGSGVGASNIFVTVLRFGDEAGSEFVPFVPANFGSKPTYSVIFIRKFDFEGQGFCYEVFASPVTGHSTSGRALIKAQMSNFLYYDGDGDGVFETFEWGTTSTLEDGPPIPKWVSKIDRGRSLD